MKISDLISTCSLLLSINCIIYVNQIINSIFRYLMFHRINCSFLIHSIHIQLKSNFSKFFCYSCNSPYEYI